MSGVNKVIIMGRLGMDPEVKQFDDGGSLTKFSIATSETWNDKATGEKKERTEWHNITARGKTGELCAQYLSKGRMAYVEGKLQTRSWEDGNGQKRYATEIMAMSVQFIGGKKEDTQGSFAEEPFKTYDEAPAAFDPEKPVAKQMTNAAPQTAAEAAKRQADKANDEIPF